MNVFDVLTMIGGLCLFLFGMNIMGSALERRAGGSLRSVLKKMTTNKAAGLFTGLGVTSVIQSSSATTVMVVGFVNSGLMSLKQAINVIMGANIGTTVTAWILSLSGIESDNVIVKLFKPTSFAPILALIGILLYMFFKDNKKKDTGMILLGFATLMFGMDTMSGAVAGLADVPAFREIFLLFKNPLLGVLVGAVLTGIIQSSSASVGILQALAATGQISFGAAIPIIMGQNIGTCVTSLISCVGTNKNAKRAAVVHLLFNVIGTVVWLIIYYIVEWFVSPALFDETATAWGIAVAHSAFNILCTVILLPQTGLLEKLAYIIVKDGKTKDTVTRLDERLIATPSIALERCRALAVQMGETACASLKNSLSCIKRYDAALAKDIREKEDETDKLEDSLGTYLIKLSAENMSDADSAEAAGLLKVIGDFERLADHSVNIVESAEEMRDKKLTFTDEAKAELDVIMGAVTEIVDLANNAFINNDIGAAVNVEPLEQVIDELKKKLRTNHITRLQKGQCTVIAGFVWEDLLTNLERTSDHCSNIAGCLVDMSEHNMNTHESLRALRNNSEEYFDKYKAYTAKYELR
ncbi:MAG: Na/Pi cotransporter family protein [Christensenellaceae bacterium]|nr:Na/Pi cotransporter family protein [Christensenellaceae bacterium]